MSAIVRAGDINLDAIDAIHPDGQCDHAQAGQFLAIGASAVGASHRKHVRPRDDAFAMTSNGRWLVAAICDGLGSRPHSRFGATFVANRLADSLLEDLASADASSNQVLVIRNVFGRVRLAVAGRAEALGVEPAGIGCTAVVLALDSLTGQCIAVRAGDGAILALEQSGTVVEITAAPESDHPQETYTVMDTADESLLGIRVWPEPFGWQALFLMSDGISDDLLFTACSHEVETWTAQVRRTLRTSPDATVAAQGMQSWLATYQKPGSWDDRTLIVVSPVSSLSLLEQPQNEQRCIANGQ